VAGKVPDAAAPGNGRGAVAVHGWCVAFSPGCRHAGSQAEKARGAWGRGVWARALGGGYRYIGGPPERLATFLKAEIAKWDELGQNGSFK
jgi:hypothetical protein